MEDLIKALQIFKKYKNTNWPTHCEHDVLMIVGITYDEVTDADKDELESLNFQWSNEHNCWVSYRFGSA